MLTTAQLTAFLPTLSNVPAWVAALNTVFERYGLASLPRQAAFLAQTAHESAGFTHLVENLNYSAEGLVKTWPTRFTTVETATPFAHNPERIANYVYASRMGNGDVASGDGWRFRGRGLLQLTGRTNYASVGERVQLPLTEQPELLEQPGPAALTAGDFWETRGLNALADVGTDDAFTTITKRINGGTTGSDQRRLLLAHAVAALS